jgi:hypothetical protein
MPALRSPLVQLALAANLVGGAVGLGCGSDPTPRGYHSSNIAWSEQDMGIVWLNRRAPYEAVMFARSGEDLKLRGPSIELTQHAWHSDPPLVASDGRGWLVAWTQAGGRDPGLFVRQVGPGGPEGPQRTIVESTVRLCPQLVWTGEAYVVGWNEGDEIYLGRVGSYAMLEEAPLRIAHEASIEACSVALGNGELGVLWSVVHGDERSLSMARVSRAARSHRGAHRGARRRGADRAGVARGRMDRGPHIERAGRCTHGAGGLERRAVTGPRALA